MIRRGEPRPRSAPILARNFGSPGGTLPAHAAGFAPNPPHALRPLFGILLLVAPSPSALATFHLMHIYEVVAGVGGDPSAQAIELRMRFDDQGHVIPTRLVARDARGANPVVLIDLASEVANAAPGDSILLASAAIAAYTDPPLSPDFTLTNVIPESYLAAGTLTFENDDGTTIVARLSWGGTGYTGPTAGADFNDDNGDYGTPADGPLRVAGTNALRFTRAYNALSTTNAQDYQWISSGVVLTANNRATYNLVGCLPQATEDADGDGYCGDFDNCPQVSNVDQADRDDDGLGDACDDCPDDPLKQEPGICGCGSDELDADADGVCDPQDNCPAAVNPDQADGDADGVGDTCDGCPDDPRKRSPDVCGCGAEELDADSDGVCDTIDNCSGVANADQSDRDADGRGDACDACPDDPLKTEPGTCGCGELERDIDSDGVVDCVDAQVLDPNAPAAVASGATCSASAAGLALAPLVSLVLAGKRARHAAGRTRPPALPRSH